MSVTHQLISQFLRSRIMLLAITWLILSLFSKPTQQYVDEDLEAWGCQGAEITYIKCSNPAAKLVMKSVTVVSSSNADRIMEAGTKCTQDQQVHECQRRISGGSADSGLSADYKFFYDYSVQACVGKNACSSLSLPQWWALTGDSVVPYILDARKETFNRTCPKEGVKYFSGAFYHFECRAGEEINTDTAPADTTPRTRPTTPTTISVMFAVNTSTFANRKAQPPITEEPGSSGKDGTGESNPRNPTTTQPVTEATTTAPRISLIARQKMKASRKATTILRSCSHQPTRWFLLLTGR